MKKISLFFATFVGLILCSFSVEAQSTFASVQTLFQTKCSASGCHGGTSPLVFDVTAPADDLFAALVNVDPANPAALQKGQKLVDPGHPYNSFLMKKIGSVNGFDSFIKLEQGEGNVMPSNGMTLEKHEIELVRQWIIAGAPKTGSPVNIPLLLDYYKDGGLDFVPVPPAPPAGKGIQIRNGPYFLAPNEEFEIIKKERVGNPTLMKVGKIDGYMSWQSHHMLLFKYNDDGSNIRDGYRKVPIEGFPFGGNTTLTGAWQNDGEFELPVSTALYWQANTLLDFDYHIKNYSSSEILPADFYLNVYYFDDPQYDNPIEVKAQLENDATLGGGPLQPFLLPGVTRRTSTHSFGGDRYIYMLSSHTHKFGTDYDIFLRNPDGTKGELIYEGFFNEDYTFNQGFYDWAHPPVRYFEPLKKATNGLIYEVEWTVSGVPFVTFGLTTADEMMLFTYLYTEEELKIEQPTGIYEKDLNNNLLSVLQNPFQNSTQIRFSVPQTANVSIQIFDMLGKKVNTVFESSNASGDYTEFITSNHVEDRAGMYLVTMIVDGKPVSTKKITKL